MRKIMSLAISLGLLATPALAQDVDLSEVSLPEERLEEITLEPGSGVGDTIGKHKFVLNFTAASNATNNLIREKFIKDGIFAEVLDDLSAQIALPFDIPITFESCGEQNAFYRSSERALHMCYELIEGYNTSYELLTGQEKEILGWADQGTVLTGTTLFIMLHEIGHAMTDIFDLPITGREEDAVDQFAAVVLINSDEEGDTFIERPSRLALLGAQFMVGLSRSPQQMDRNLFSDEHALGQQRYFDVMCMVLGSDPATYGPILTPAMVMVEETYNRDPSAFDVDKYKAWLSLTDALNVLPWHRAIRCPSEYQRYSAGWNYIIDTFMVPQEQ